jgi:hypothetical protein
MDAQKLEAADQIDPIEMAVPQNCAADVEKAEAHETDLLEPVTRESEAREAGTHETAAVDAEQARSLDESAGDGGEARAMEAEPLEAQVNDTVIEEEETQLAAIRELMTRAGARGLWLTLGEIAEATEFAEASISAQLRHLRKPRHGAHRVEKRRRGRRRASAARTLRDGRRGPMIWEYRLLPRALRSSGHAGSELRGPSTLTAKRIASSLIGETQA